MVREKLFSWFRDGEEPYPADKAADQAQRE